MAFFLTLLVSLWSLSAVPAFGQQSATDRLLEAKRQQEGGSGGSDSGGGQSATDRLLEAKRQQEGGVSGQGGEAVPIEAEGLASSRKDDPARAREEAIEAAQREAVEQASGVFITSESQMRNFELVSDEVLSRSKGFIKSYEVVNENDDTRFYRVTIKAMVVRAAFIKDVNESLENLYQRVGKPRVMLVVEEDAGNSNGGGEFVPETRQALGVVEKEIRKILLKQGFTFIDARALTKGSMVEKAAKGTDTSRENLLDNARTSKAEIVMIGTGRISSRSKLQKFNIIEASVGLDVIRTDNGQVMASEVTLGKGLHINESAAMVGAFKKAANDLTPRIMEQVTYLWIKEKNEGQRIEMIVRNISFGDVLQLRQTLANELRGVKKVRQKSYSKGVALLELESKERVDRLAEALYAIKFDGFKLDIQDVTATTLTVEVKK